MRKKISKLRGSKTHGHGSKKKRRGAGSRGGRGMAGSSGHKKVKLIKYKPNHFGKKGFKSLKARKLKPAGASVNLGELERLSSGKKEIDVTALGYDKVLGKGKIPSKLTVKARAFSKKAAEKIGEAGGKAITV